MLYNRKNHLKNQKTPHPIGAVDKALTHKVSKGPCRIKFYAVFFLERYNMMGVDGDKQP